MPTALLTDRLEVRARQIVADLGGTWSCSRGMCRCPAHEDRTPSLSVTLGSRAILFHCFAGCANDEVLAALAQRGVKASSLFDGRTEPIRTALPETVPSESIQRLWREATYLADSPAERYLVGRGISAGSPDLRYHPRTPLGPKGAVRFLPALLAAVRTDLGVVALHRTFLECKTFTVARFDGPKRALGALGRGAVRLHGPRGGKLGLAEGIETALSVRELFGIPCWATLGTERYGLVSVPESVSELHLFIDHDAAGDQAERRARAAYEREGRVIVTHRPKQPGADFNDVLRARQPVLV
ncbi:toprim domain-containing protein [Novosphingobium sp.]|uniref:DUF7146 domain-containing protein n=1 Tax=Novosphingobium sp. TaxID=1874826 RepID=UPI00263413C8|nr:toprim domain-containing protein [Novosphingobium sp.]